MDLKEINNIFNAYFTGRLKLIISEEDEAVKISIYDISSFIKEAVFLKVTTIEDSYGTTKIRDFKFVTSRPKTVIAYEEI